MKKISLFAMAVIGLMLAAVPVLAQPANAAAENAAASSAGLKAIAAGIGFAIAVFPTAIAGAIFQLNKYSGRFHGEISPTMPRG